MSYTWAWPAKTTATPRIELSAKISSRPLSPHLHSTPGKCFRAISTAPLADSYTKKMIKSLVNRFKARHIYVNWGTSVRLHMALRETRLEISASLGMYWVFTNVPAPRMAIWGASAIFQNQITVSCFCANLATGYWILLFLKWIFAWFQWCMLTNLGYRAKRRLLSESKGGASFPFFFNSWSWYLFLFLSFLIPKVDGFFY